MATVTRCWSSQISVAGVPGLFFHVYNSMYKSHLIPVDIWYGPPSDLDLPDEPPAALAVDVVQTLPKHRRELK